MTITLVCIDVPKPMTVSGNVISLPATTVVKVSGEHVKIQVPTSIVAGYVQLNDLSGGIELYSASVVSVVVRNSNTSGKVWINQSGLATANAAFLLRYNDPPLKIELDQINKLYAVAEMSGDYASFMGQVS
jgi:hypothetical protein